MPDVKEWDTIHELETGCGCQRNSGRPVGRYGWFQRMARCKLITRGTVEEKILALQRRKQSLADGLLRTCKPGFEIGPSII